LHAGGVIVAVEVKQGLIVGERNLEVGRHARATGLSIFPNEAKPLLTKSSLIHHGNSLAGLLGRAHNCLV
jgi:hypothetical protein